MEFIFFGTPHFAVYSLKALIENNFIPSLVVTQPDRPQGRSGKPISTPVKSFAQEFEIQVLNPDKIDTLFKEKIEAINPDLLVVVAYGNILPGWLLRMPAKGSLNLHASLLPAYRGAAPIQRAILNDENLTGVTIMLMDEGMDTGPILTQEKVSIEDDDTAGSLAVKLAKVGSRLLVDTIPRWLNYKIMPKNQPDASKSLAPKIEKKERIIDWTLSANEINNRIRALNPNPGAYTLYRGKILKLWKADVIDSDSKLEPGEVIQNSKEFKVATGKNIIKLHEVQPEGKKRMSGHQFLLGYALNAGEKLGS